VSEAAISLGVLTWLLFGMGFLWLSRREVRGLAK
jgi:hypothetical protein